MKIIILHGDNTPKLYARLSKFLEVARERNWEIINDEIIPTASLFGKERLFVFRKYSLLTTSQIKNLSRLDGTLIIYHEGTIAQAFLKSLPEPKNIEEFTLPKIIWNFLDKPTVKVFHELTKYEPVEFVFNLLAKQMRDLYWVKTDPKTLFYPSWRLTKLKNQATRYTTREVVRIINELADIDIKVKTSKADLVSSLDLLILTKLE